MVGLSVEASNRAVTGAVHATGHRPRFATFVEKD
jgi:hypothetical protein